MTMSDEGLRWAGDGRRPQAKYLEKLAHYEGPVQEKERRARVSRLVILELATRLFAERGFWWLKVGEIYRETEYSRQTFFNDFSSKEECFEACVAAALARLQAEVSEAISDVSDFEARLRGATVALVGFATVDPAGMKLIVAESLVATSAGFEECLAKVQRFWRWFFGEIGGVAADGSLSVGALAGVGAIEELLRARLRGDGAVVAANLVPVIERLVGDLLRAER
jgi:AcrR family transcriptional regulator